MGSAILTASGLLFGVATFCFAYVVMDWLVNRASYSDDATAGIVRYFTGDGRD